MNIIVRIDAAGTVFLFAGNGANSSTGDGGPAKSASFANPCVLAVDSAGLLYIADGNRIRRVGTDGIVTVFAGNGGAGHSGDGGPAINATFNTPSALAFDTRGNLLIADTANHVIREVTPDGTIQTIAGTGQKSSGGDGGPALQAGLNSPAGVAADSSGNIYISDTGNNQIRVVSPDGTIQRYAGQSSSLTTTPFGGGNPNLALNATLSSPKGLALDSAGNLYLLETGAGRIRRITKDGKIGPYAGTGISGASGDGGWAWAANLNSPLGIAMDSKNELLIADAGNNRVRIVKPSNAPVIGSEPSNIISTLAGNGLFSFSPRGLAVSGNTVYFSDASNRVRRLDLATGEVALVAGNPSFEDVFRCFGISGKGKERRQGRAKILGIPGAACCIRLARFGIRTLEISLAEIYVNITSEN